MEAGAWAPIVLIDASWHNAVRGTDTRLATMWMMRWPTTRRGKVDTKSLQSRRGKVDTKSDGVYVPKPLRFRDRDC